jgi:hypothetical protein
MEIREIKLLQNGPKETINRQKKGNNETNFPAS